MKPTRIWSSLVPLIEACDQGQYRCQHRCTRWPRAFPCQYNNQHTQIGDGGVQNAPAGASGRGAEFPPELVVFLADKFEQACGMCGSADSNSHCRPAASGRWTHR